MKPSHDPSRRRRRSFLLAVVTGLCAAWSVTPAAAQMPERTAGGRRPTVGVALSGGGAKGFAHIGVLKVLEEAGVRVDVVTGTSMGGIIGGLYAVGYSPAQIEKVVLEQDWNALFGDVTLRRLQPVDRRLPQGRYALTLPLSGGRVQLPRGLVAGQQISMLLTRLLLPARNVRDFRALPRPFACVATDLETGEGVRLEHGFLPRAIRAGAAIPSVFAPVSFEGRTFIDGGVVRNLPAEDARALGADRVICVDVSDRLLPADSLHSLVEVLRQVANFQIGVSTRIQENYCDLVIHPDMRGFDSFSYDAAPELIRRGEDAARAARRALQPPAATAAAPPPHPPPPVFPDSLRIDRIEIRNLSPDLEKQVRGLLRLRLPVFLTVDDIEAIIDNIYALRLFDYVIYQLDPGDDPDGQTLVIEAAENPGEHLGVSLRYETHLKASVLVSAFFRNRLRFGSRLGVDVRLGEVFRTNLVFAYPLRRRPDLDLRFGALFADVPFDIFEDNVRTLSLRTESRVATVSLNLMPTRPLLISGGLWAELFNADQSVGRLDALNVRRGLLGVNALLLFDTFDRPDFPTRGLRMTALSTFFNERWGSGVTFSHHSFLGQVRAPLTDRLALFGLLGLGHNAGANTPLHYRFYLGGAGTGGSSAFGLWQDRQIPLLGFEIQQLAGRNMQMAGLGLQFEVRSNLYTTFRWNAARVMERWTWRLEPSAFHGGFGLQFGAETLIGPLVFTLMSRRPFGSYALKIDVGYRF